MPLMPSSSLAVASGPEDPHIPISPAPASTAMPVPPPPGGDGPTPLLPHAHAALARTHDTSLRKARPKDIDTGRPPCYRSPTHTAALGLDPRDSIPEGGGAPMPDRALSPHQVLVAPREPLVAGGPAEEYERRVHELFRTGCRHLIADLRGVSSIDSAGIRALVRSHTTAQRIDGQFTIVAPQPDVRHVLALSRLDSVFHIRESLEEARVPAWRQRDVHLILGGAALCAALWWARASFPGLPASLRPWSVFVRDMGKFVAAGLIGLLVTAVQRRFQDKPMTQAMEHAEVLLCVSGALVMMIIGESLARAFGIAGAASIIRFRTPVEDPKDITVLAAPA